MLTTQQTTGFKRKFHYINLYFQYAVTRLRQADDEELLLYLLQLVQALKYENFDEIHLAYEREKESIQHTSPRRDTASSIISESDRDRSGSFTLIHCHLYLGPIKETPIHVVKDNDAEF